MTFWPFINFFSFIVFLQLAVYILVKNPKSALNRVCFALILCFSIWSFGKIFIHNPLVPEKSVRLLEKINSLGWISLSSFFLWFALIFAQKKKLLKIKLFYVPLLSLPALFIYKYWHESFVRVFVKKPYGWAIIFPDSIWDYFFYAYYFSFLILGFYLIYNFGQKVKGGAQKNQSKIIFKTGIITLILGSLTDVILPEFNIYSIPDLANVFALIWAVGLVYAMAKYKFLTISPATAAENIISTMNDLLVLLDAEGKIVDVNQAGQDISGYRDEELKGESINFLFENGTSKDDLSTSVLNKERIGNYKVFLRTKDRRKIPVLFSSSLLKDNLGSLTGVVCAAKDISDYLRVEEARKESEERFRNIAENLPNMVFIYKRHQVVYVNKKTEEIMGYRKEELYSPQFEFSKLIDSEQMGIARDHRKMFLAGKEVGPIEYRLITKRGERIDALVVTRLITYEGEKALLGIATDITERKRVEEKLKESERKYRNLAENLNEMIYRADPETLAPTYVNSAVENIFGYTPEEWLGNEELWKNALNPGDKNRVMSQILEAQKKQENTTIDYRIIKKDGSEGWVENRLSWEKDRRGNVVSLDGIIYDVSERKKGEITLRILEERYRELVEKAGVAILIDDEEGNFKYFNRKFAQLFGYSLEEMRVQSIHSIIHPDDVEQVLRIHRGRLEGKEVPIRYELRGIRKDKSIVYLEADVTLLKAGEKSIGTRSYIWDTTKRKQAEEMLQKSEERYRLISELTSDYIFKIQVDAHQKLKMVEAFGKDSQKKGFGLLGREIIADVKTPELWEKIVHPEDKGRLSNFFQTILAGQVAELECRLVEEGDKISWYRVFGRPEWDKSKKQVTGIVGAAKDITGFKLTETQLKKLREKYQSLAELASDAVLNLDLKGRVVSCNPALLNLSGYSQQDIVGHRFSELRLLPQEEIPRYEGLFKSLLKGQVPASFTTQWLHADGSVHSGEVHIVLITEDGQPAGIQVVARDISANQQGKL